MCYSNKFPQSFAIKFFFLIVIICNVNKLLTKRMKILYEKKVVDYNKREKRKEIRSKNFCECLLKFYDYFTLWVSRLLDFFCSHTHIYIYIYICWVFFFFLFYNIDVKFIFKAFSVEIFSLFLVYFYNLFICVFTFCIYIYIYIYICVFERD